MAELHTFFPDGGVSRCQSNQTADRALLQSQASVSVTSRGQSPHWSGMWTDPSVVKRILNTPASPAQHPARRPSAP